MPGPGSPVPGTLSRTSHDRDSPREDADVKEPVMPGAVPNPLRSVLDRRLPRIAGPCVLVLFGVTGDLSRKKLLPAIYDLANRGLLPPGFGLVGFARRDWADQDFTQVAYDAVRTHARTPFREDVWRQLSEGCGSSPARRMTTPRLMRWCAPCGNWTRAGAPAAITRSTFRFPRNCSPRCSPS